MYKYIAILFVSCFLWVSAVHAIEYTNDTRMLRDDGGNAGGSSNATERIIERSRNNLKSILDVLQRGAGGTDGGTTSPRPSVGPTQLPISITPITLPPASTMLNNENLTYPDAIKNAVRPCLSQKSVYDSAAGMTGVPWQILASIHYREGGCGANQSLVSGRAIGQNEPDLHGNCSSQDTGIGKARAVAGGCVFDNLLDTAVYAGFHLRGKIDNQIPSRHEQLAEAFAGYNGWGNTNCGKTPYPHCPPAFPGDDHVYVFNKNPDGKHETMYLIYCADNTPCAVPPVYSGYGAMTVAGAIDELYREQNGN